MSSDDSPNVISTSAFISALQANFGIACVLLIFFCIARPKLKRVYAPKTYSVEKRKKVSSLGDGFFDWIIPTIKISENYVLCSSNLDSYMILRTLRFLRNFFLATSIISCSIILPINMQNSNNSTDLSRFSASNLYKDSNKFWFHLIYYVITIGLVLYILLRESALFIRLRQRALLKSRIQKPEKAHTILVSGLKNEYLDENYLKKIFGILPGGVKRVVVNKDASELEILLKQREKIIQNLEVTLTKYIIVCEKLLKKKRKTSPDIDPETIPPPPHPIKSYLRLRRNGKLSPGFETVDLIELFSNQLLEINKKIFTFKETELKNLKNKSSAFITFNDQISAHLAVQSIVSQDLTSVTPKLLDTEQSDVIWSDISVNPYSKKIKIYISSAITLFLALTWGSLSYSITTLTNIDFLLKAFNIDTSKVTFLSKLNGFIPALLLSILVSILPYFLMFLVRMEGRPRRSDVDFDVCNRFFLFLVFTVFVLPQFSNTLNGLVLKFTGILSNTQEVLNQVIEYFIISNTLFVTFVVLRTFLSTAVFLLMIPSVLNRSLKPYLFAISPRQIYMAEKPTKFEWQTMIPQHLLVFLIGLNYSAISPLINPFCFLYFLLFYYIYKFKFKYIYDQDQFSLGGTSFVCILHQTFKSLFMVEFVWLLIMVANGVTTKSGVARVIVSAAVLVYTFRVYGSVKRNVFPYFYYLPIALHDASPNFDSELSFNSNLKDTNDLAENIDESIVDEKAGPSVTDDVSQRSVNDVESSLESEKSPVTPFLQHSSPLTRKSKHGKIIPEISKSSQKVYSHILDFSKNVLVVERNFKTKSYKPKTSKRVKTSSSMEEYGYSDSHKQFINPAILANFFSFVWTPYDDSGLTKDLVAKVNMIGEGYFSVVSKGAFINGRNKVGIDFNFDFTHFETLALS
ncbi:hypothetical protein AYI69_g9448 [Smittium culicis]|uniref:Calcium permeable stress-gated cation channel 1 n=1 Tax=Smittium culicis TaxID=133412 RepID=A0A1R1XCG3_9FUNG|nr:hypothetical protein AYI69_g9448 [Smittium culicis]